MAFIRRVDICKLFAVTSTTQLRVSEESPASSWCTPFCLLFGSYWPSIDVYLPWTHRSRYLQSKFLLRIFFNEYKGRQCILCLKNTCSYKLKIRMFSGNLCLRKSVLAIEEVNVSQRGGHQSKMEARAQFRALVPLFVLGIECRALCMLSKQSTTPPASCHRCLKQSSSSFCVCFPPVNKNVLFLAQEQGHHGLDQVFDTKGDQSSLEKD